ncbi:hypothetical protein ABC974_09375 [Sphingomonas oligophenolica]|uniref:Uncharacterized protein n=1 Tax=Sphingomonas oligophenolica TaxID=301154 RepID=A0ABU9Y211_9SPHN
MTKKALVLVTMALLLFRSFHYLFSNGPERSAFSEGVLLTALFFSAVYFQLRSDKSVDENRNELR